MQPAHVTIRTGCRLHFGPLSYRPAHGRHFGGIGLMLNRPGVELTATTETADLQRPGELHSTRASAMWQTIRSLNPDLHSPVTMQIATEIPSHTGLGSGTQLSLAILEALLKLHDRTATLPELAEKCGRGDRSAIGLYGYDRGGFLIDAGHAEGAALGELAVRVPVPEAWRVLLLIPQDAHGLHGGEELQAFQKLGPMPEHLSGTLCRLALTEILPALGAQKLHLFASALFEYGQRVGEFFAPTQGGIFTSPEMNRLQYKLQGVAETGMAQSSWGPAIAMFAENDDHAMELRRRIESLVSPNMCRTEITSPCNSGRELQRLPVR